MNFDKKTYWARRRKGLRGQTGIISKRGLIVSKGPGQIPWATVGNKPVSIKAFKKNTKRARAYNAGVAKGHA